MSHAPDEAQLTAYLLGELSPEDAAQVEAQLAVSAALQAEFAGLRQTVASLEAALAQQTSPEVMPLDRDKLHAMLQSAVVTRHEPTVSAPALLATAPPQELRRGSSLAWLVAASVLVVGGLAGLSQWGSDARNSMATSVSDSSHYLALHGRNDSEVAKWQQSFRDGAATATNLGTGLQREQLDAGLVVSAQSGREKEVRIVQEQAGQWNANGIVADERGRNTNFFSLGDNEVQAQKESNLDIDFYRLNDVELSAINPQSLSELRHKITIWEELPGTRGEQSLEPYEFANSAMGGRRLLSRSFSTAAWDSDALFDLSRARSPSGDPSLSSSTHWPFDVPQSDRYDRLEGMMFEQKIPESLAASSAGESRAKQPTEYHKGHRFMFLDDFEVPAATPPLPAVQLGLDVESKTQHDVSILSKSEAISQAQTPPTPTVADYENGFVQLGQSVHNWGEFQKRWYRNKGLDPLARGTTAAESKPPALLDEDIDEIHEFTVVVTEQAEGLKKLREVSPEVADKPLAEVDAEAAKRAELAMGRVYRELQRQQRVWYYREGYVRQLEATIAAAEQYAHVPENDFVTPEAQPLSTFGIDVDTASYSNVRRFVEAGQLPPPDAVRIEELVNSFQYDGPKVEGEHPLAVAAEVSVCPWQPQHQLLRVALKGKSIDLQQRPPARLVFLVDTSGSMSDENKLPLVKQSLRILVDQMREQDRLSIVTYSDNAGLLLDSTGGDKREAILAAIDGLVSDGSTNGEAGLKLAYEVAVKQFGEGATNRVMLCTDGDFNVGESADSELVKLIEKERQTGVFLNIFGFGSGNLKDAKLEAIADKGNGQYIYIDGIKEARKTLLNELTGTLYTIAKDVKLQIEFNPNLVGSYRLVGYENRAMAAQDFSNDKVDSGDMGAGHSVVAMYEIVPPGAPQPVAPQSEVEPLKYQRAKAVGQTIMPAPSPDPVVKTSEASPGFESPAPPAATPPADPPAPAVDRGKVPVPPADPLATELCTIRVRYKQPNSNESTKVETVVHHPMLLLGANALTSRDHVWATAVAQFGLLARHSTFVGTGNYSQVLELAQSAIGDDPTGQRREFVTLVRQTQHLSLERERQIAEISRRAEEHRRVVDEIKTVEKTPEVMNKANCNGKYKTLLRRIEVADDATTYGEFKDFGRWDGGEYKTHQNLPHGYWVYVAPHWYIWGESTEQAAVDTAK